MSLRILKTLTGLALAACTSLALAAIDVNKADQAALESVKGIGPKMSVKILAERKAGPFKDWPDFMNRIAGVGAKSAVKLSEGGLTINGMAYGAKGATPAAAAPARVAQAGAPANTAPQAAGTARK